MRRRESLDPAVEHDLEALEAALSGAPGADPALVALARDVRAAAPRPGARARAALDARVEAGFSRPARPGRRLWRAAGTPSWPRRLVPAGGVLAAALVAVVVALSAGDRGGGGGSASDPAVTGERAPGAPRPPGAPAPRESSDSAGAGAAPRASDRRAAQPPATATPAVPLAPAAPGRRVERDVRLELGARADRFDSVTDRVVRATQRAGGHVAGSQIARDGGRGTATFVLRIPAARLDAAVAELSRLAHVRSIEQATQDLTGAHDGTASRLRDARTRRRALVAALATATGGDAARLRGRLAGATGRVRRLERQLRSLRARTAFATVDLTVVGSRRAVAAPARGGRWTPADALDDARRGLEVAAGVLILVAAFALPLALVAAPAALALGALRRRRREAALDAA
jgi:hypothetical protein